MSLVSQRDSKNLKDFIDASLQFHIVLYDCHKTISDYGTADLDANSILRCSPGFLDTQMLLDPFEEQFHAPSIAVEIGNCFGRRRQIVGQKDVSGTVFGVNADNLTEFSE